MHKDHWSGNRKNIIQVWRIKMSDFLRKNSFSHSFTTFPAAEAHLRHSAKLLLWFFTYLRVTTTTKKKHITMWFH